MTIGESGRRSGVLARHKAAFALLALTALLLGAFAVSAAHLNRQLSAIPRMDLDLGSDVAEDPVLGRYTRPARPTGDAANAVNLLVAGVDAGESHRIAADLEDGKWTPGSHRSDVIMVVHLSADRQEANVVSIPRDTWVQIDGYGMGKINAALSYGGPSLFVRTIEQFTSLRMDHVVIVEWAGFTKLVDALGGVEVRPGGSAQSATLNGEAALDYVRERRSLPRGDLDRIQRQQNVVRAISRQLMSADVLANPLRLNEVLEAVTSSVALDDDFTDERVRELALSLRGLRGNDVRQLTMPVAGFDRIDGQSVVLADHRGSKALFGAVMTDEIGEYVATHEVDTLPEPALVD